jgi:hypothetical protein
LEFFRAELASILNSSILKVLLIKEVRKGRHGIERSSLGVGEAFLGHSNNSDCDGEVRELREFREGKA